MAAAAAKTVEAALWNFSWDQFRENHRVPNALFNDYLRFLALKAAASDFNASVLSPPTAIERIWHVHLHDTRHYRAMCDTIVPGHFIHHDPKDRDGGNEDPVQRSHRRQQAVRRYEATWGNPPGIWQLSEHMPHPAWPSPRDAAAAASIKAEALAEHSLANMMHANAYQRVLVYDQTRYKEKCTYLGDRILGITFAFKLAERTNRTFCIKWDSSCHLANFLAPRYHDWRCPGFRSPPRAPLYTFHGLVDRIDDNEYRNLMEVNMSVIKVRTNHRMLDDVVTQAFNKLFSVRAHLSSVVRSIMVRTLNKSPSCSTSNGALVRPSFTGLHIRMGDGAPNSSVYAAPWFRNDVRLGFEQAIALVRNTSRQHKCVLMATDNAQLHDWVLHRGPANVVAWERTTEEQSAIYAHNTFQHLNVSFIESLLLGASSCIVPGAITVEKERLRRPKPQNVTMGASSSFVRIATSAFSRLAMLFGNVPLCVHPDEEAQ
jgi:hypothetical protein